MSISADYSTIVSKLRLITHMLGFRTVKGTEMEIFESSRTDPQSIISNKSNYINGQISFFSMFSKYVIQMKLSTGGLFEAYKGSVCI